MDKRPQDKNETWTPEQTLQMIRKGYSEKLKFFVADLELKCRVLSAREQYQIMGRVKTEMLNNPGVTQDEGSLEMRKTVEYQKAILRAATTHGMQSEVDPRFWDHLPSSVLANAFDRYNTILREIDPEFEKLDTEKITEMMSLVKKKECTWRDFYTSDLAVMGRYFLETLSAMDSAPGS